MANITKQIGELITCDGTAQLVTISSIDSKSDVTFFLAVHSGTGVKIGKDSIASSAHAFASTETVPPVTCQNGRYCIQGTNGDTCSITIG